jgi:hypothetical protein
MQCHYQNRFGVYIILRVPFALRATSQRCCSPLQADLVDDHGPHELKIAEALAREQIGLRQGSEPHGNGEGR